MLGGRSFLTCAGSCVRQSLSKPTFLRSLSSSMTLHQSSSSAPQPAIAIPPISELKLISKRFCHETLEGSQYGGLAAKLLAAAVGAVIAGASGTLKAACAKDDKCCVEKKCEDSACLRKMECEEEMIVKANADLEKALKEVKNKAIEYTESAMKAYCVAIGAIKDYMDQGYCVIDQDELEPPEYEETWCCVYKIAKDRSEKVKAALQKGQCAWELLCRLREVIESGKNCKYTGCNPLLVTAEESLTCGEKELLLLKGKMDCVISDHDLVDQYRDCIEMFKKDLKGDVDKIVESGECCIEFAEQEQALMIMEAYKRAVRVHKEVAQVMVCSGNIPERLQKTII